LKPYLSPNQWLTFEVPWTILHDYPQKMMTRSLAFYLPCSSVVAVAVVELYVLL